MPPYWGKDAEPITGVLSERPPRRLLKGVPGIPQGSRLFFETFSAELLLMGFKASVADCCLFLKPGKEFTAVVVWVDDFVFVHEKEATWDDSMFISQANTIEASTYVIATRLFLAKSRVHQEGLP